MKCARPDCGNDARQRWCSDRCARWGYRNRDADRPNRAEQLSRVAELLEANNIDLDELGAVKGVRLTEWDALARGKDGEETRVVPMRSASVVLHPTWATGPAWPVIQQANPVTVRVERTPRREVDPAWKTALLLPDPQFGFRRDLSSGELDPFHDEKALSVALQIAEVERPDLTIWLGDVLDFAPFGKYQQEPGFALTVQPTLDAAHSWLARFAAVSGESRYISGNHDIRLQNAIIDNAKAAFGIKRAGAPPEEWPVMSVPYLLRLEELGITYVPGYPAGATYINDNVAAIHGSKIGNATRTSAAMVVEDERVSVVTGHVHRIETAYRTRNTRGRAKISFAHTPGCLCRIDGAVPSTKGGLDDFGRPVRSWENWQQGISIIRYQDGDGRFTLESVPIFDGWAMHHGREFIA